MKIYVHNTQTGKIVERDMTEAEITQWEIDQAENEAKAKSEAKAQNDRSDLLLKLGITDDEAKLLLS